jgi:hypothetical protein
MWEYFRPLETFAVRFEEVAARHACPHRFTGEHAAHITEILCATTEAAKTGRPVDIVLDFPAPAPMEWAI